MFWCPRELSTRLKIPLSSSKEMEFSLIWASLKKIMGAHPSASKISSILEETSTKGGLQRSVLKPFLILGGTRSHLRTTAELEVAFPLV